MIQDVAFAGPGGRLTDRIGLGVLTRLIGRDVIDEVLAETGRTERRSRLLPARVVVYYVLALCLFFGEGYEEVMRRLAEGLRWPEPVKLIETSGGWIYLTGLLGLDGGAGLVDPHLGGQGRG